MDHVDDNEKNAKISDSAYSNSCSNSQTRRSLSSKSTRSGSNSSGSSGYGGKPFANLTLDSSNLKQCEKRPFKKNAKKKKLPALMKSSDVVMLDLEGPKPLFADSPTEKINVVSQKPETLVEENEEDKDVNNTSHPNSSQISMVTACYNSQISTCASTTSQGTTDTKTSDAFSYVISMLDGLVMYTTHSLTACLGFPKNMWIGRPFADFIHPRDRNMFASQISDGLAATKNQNVTPPEASNEIEQPTSVFCRIRKYRGLIGGFGVREKAVVYVPFKLKLTFINLTDEEEKLLFLAVRATQVVSAFKVPNEKVQNSVPFVLRHLASGAVDYIGPESVPYLGFLPQDILHKDALQLYHDDDLNYLRKIYSLIVKDGAVSMCKAFRIMAQNGDYVKCKTEWSSFINPWSRKLEFVIGKHYVVEGPTNPDVFMQSDENIFQQPNETKRNAQAMRESIIRIIDEVLTKPTEVAKQQMTKRCHNLANFVESFIDVSAQPGDGEKATAPIVDPTFNLTEAVKIGNVSYNQYYPDNKSSMESPISYNQLNYNETLQRYFDHHLKFYVETEKPMTEEPSHYSSSNNQQNEHEHSNKLVTRQLSGDSFDMNSSCESGSNMLPSNTDDSGPIDEFQPFKLTKAVIQKHNKEMEKDLMMKHRKNRLNALLDKKRLSIEKRQRKKEHIARCNAPFIPTSEPPPTKTQSQGVKRSSTQNERSHSEHKLHCPSRQPTKTTEAKTHHHATNVQHHNHTNRNATTSDTVPYVYSAPTCSHVNPAPAPRPMHTHTERTMHYPEPHGLKRGATLCDSVPVSHKHYCANSRYSLPRFNAPPPPQIRNQNPWPMAPAAGAFIPGLGVPPQVSVMGPVGSMKGMFLLYIGDADAGPITVNMHACMNQPNNLGHQMPQIQPMMFRQAVIGSPIMCAPLSPTLSFPLHQSVVNQAVQFTPGPSDPKIHGKQVREKAKVYLRTSKSQWWDNKRDSLSSLTLFENDNNHISSTSALQRSTEALPEGMFPRDNLRRLQGSSDENIDRTDGESSYSSFYSSFFKTESGSAEDSGDGKKSDTDKECVRYVQPQPRPRIKPTTLTAINRPKTFKQRTVNPPWLEQVCVTTDLVYKYQLLTKNMDDVLLADKTKMMSLEQPSLVNDQLNQFYLEMQLKGGAPRLTLEEGITSSSSSGEETSTSFSMTARKKREYSRLVMIYEEDAPLPPVTDKFIASITEVPS